MGCNIVCEINKLQQLVHTCQVVYAQMLWARSADANDGSHALGTRAAAAGLTGQSGRSGVTVLVANVVTNLRKCGGWCVVFGSW